MAEGGAFSEKKKLSPESKLFEAKKLKAEGNDYFKNRNFKKAIGKYHRSIFYLKALKQNNCSMPLTAFMAEFQERETPVAEEVLNEAVKMERDCYNNLAACLLMVEPPNYERILQYCSEVLELEPFNTKALYRRGVSLYHLRNLDSALETLNLARTHGGTADSKIKHYIDLCNRELEKQEKKMKAAYMGMFDKMSQKQNEEEDP